MLYCMAIMRLVNGVVEKTRKKEEVSIAVAAEAIGIPRMLIDVRHEGSHREHPTLQIERIAENRDEQSMGISVQAHACDYVANVRFFYLCIYIITLFTYL